jgi:hypothetical protein
MDATIAEGMTRAKEKDERFLELFNQLLERRGPNVRISSCQKAFIHVDPAIVQETPTLLNANARIRMGHTDRRVHTKAQVREGLSFLLIRCLIHDKVACSHTAVGTPQEPSTSALTHVSCLTRVKVEEGQRSSIDHRYTPSSPHTLIQRASLASISRKRPTADSCSTATTAPVPPAPGVSGSLEARTHRSSSGTVTPAIQQSSSEFAGPRGIQPLAPIVQERPENVSLPPSDIPPHLPIPPSSHLPSQSTRTDSDPPPNAIDVAPMVSSERQKGTTQRSSNSLPRSEEKKVSPIHSQTKIKRSTRASVTQKPSTKFAPFSLTPSQPGPPATRREAPSRLMMPGAFPGTSLDDVDTSSWVLVSPVGPDCQVEVSKRGWFKRMFSRRG